MKNSKLILYLLLLVFGVILVYNYIIVPLLVSNNMMGMRMGMHSTMNHYTNYYALIQFTLLIGGIVMCGLLLLGILKSDRKCKRCGYEIQNDNWRICPKCGSRVNQRRKEKK